MNIYINVFLVDIQLANGNAFFIFKKIGVIDIERGLVALDYFYGQAGELFSFYRIPKALFQGATVPESVHRCQAPVRHPAGPHEPVCEKRLAGQAEPGVHSLHDRGYSRFKMLDLFC